MVIGATKGRIAETYQDPAGRWVSVTFRRYQMSNVTIVSTYQVVDVDPETAGPKHLCNETVCILHRRRTCESKKSTKTPFQGLGGIRQSMSVKRRRNDSRRET